MRRHLNLAHSSIELISNPVSLAALYRAVHFSISGAILLAGVSLFKAAAGLTVDHSLRSDIKVRHFLFVPLKDLLILAIWFIPFFSRHVNWRGHRFRITNQTALQPAD